jgi:orotate phosphoribosyltransferase
MTNSVSAPADFSNVENFSGKRRRLLDIIKQKSILRGEFTLASGAKSNYYLDMKPTTFDPEGATLIGDIIFGMLRNEMDVSCIGGLELGSVPIITAISQRSWPERPIPGFVVRKEKKGHGTNKRIDANFQPNSTVVLIEDVTTKGGSVMQAVNAVKAEGASVKYIVTIVDRLEGATETLGTAGIKLIPLFTMTDVLG